MSEKTKTLAESRPLQPPTIEEREKWDRDAMSVYDVPWSLVEVYDHQAILDCEGGTLIGVDFDTEQDREPDCEVNCGTAEFRHIANAEPVNFLRLLDALTIAEDRIAEQLAELTEARAVHEQDVAQRWALEKKNDQLRELLEQRTREKLKWTKLHEGELK